MFLVCGEALFDMFEDSALAGNDVQYVARPGGSPYNVAIGISRLGGKSALLAAISTDQFGNRLERGLQAEGVDCNYLVRTESLTTLSVVGLNENGEPSYSIYGTSARSLTSADVSDIPSVIKGLHFGSYPIVVQPVADAFAMLLEREADRFISFDPNVRLSVEPDVELWRRKVEQFRNKADLIKVSDEDLEALYPDMEPIDIARSWLSGRTSLVILTQGAANIVALGEWGEVRITPPKVTVVDTVGAGDTFHSALIAPFSNLDDPIDALRSLTREGALQMIERASKAAAINCMRRGFDAPYDHELT